MARVQIASQSWGQITDGVNDPVGGVAAALKNLDGTAATVWSASSGGTSSTSSISTDGSGLLSGWVEEGTYTLTVGATTRRIAAVGGGYNNGAGTALRDTLASLTSAVPAFDFSLAAINKTADTSSNHVTGFFGIDVATASSDKGNVAAQFVARVTAAGASGWGVNTLVQSNQLHDGPEMGIWSAEFDINYNPPSSSGSSGIFTEAHNARGITIASGGTGRPQFAIGVEHGAGKAPFVYGIRFASDTTNASIWDSGADIFSQVQSTGHALWVAHVLEDPDPVFKLLPDRIQFGSTTSGIDTTLRREGVQAFNTDTSTFQAWHLYATHSMEIRGVDGNGYVQLESQTAAPSGSASKSRLFSRDNGSGKQQFCVQFPTGAVQVLATQP